MELLERTPEWEAARRQGIGGSEAASVFGMSPFCSAYELYQIKLGEAPAKAETEAMKWGRRLESAVAEEYAERFGRVLTLAPLVRSCEINPFMFASVDRQVEAMDDRGPGIYEGKALSGFTNLEDGLPEHIWIQVQHYLAVVKLEWAVVAMLIGGQRLEVREVDRDEEAIAYLIDGEREFMRRVELRDPPPPDGMAATGALLKRMYPASNGKTVFLESNQALAAAAQYVSAHKQFKAAESAKAASKHQLQEMLGPAEIGILPNWGKVTWKTITPKPEPTIDFERLKSEQPEIYAQYVIEQARKPYRSFLSRPLKEDQ